jgi:hypothetical protein
LNFSISILEELAIPLYALKSPLQKIPLNVGLSQTQDKIDLSRLIQTLNNKDIPLFITLNCTTHAYLASGQLISLLFQNTIEQLFENPLE